LNPEVLSSQSLHDSGRQLQTFIVYDQGSRDERNCFLAPGAFEIDHSMQRHMENGVWPKQPTTPVAFWADRYPNRQSFRRANKYSHPEGCFERTLRLHFIPWEETRIS
jgi:hypothetical protein